MNIKETFLELVKKTIPNGYESLLYPLLPKHQLDAFGNAYIIVGDKKPTNLFTSHLDTFSKDVPENITHKIKGNIIKTDGKTILGADDKAGVTIILSMIEAQVPGLYYFFTAEDQDLLLIQMNLKHTVQKLKMLSVLIARDIIQLLLINLI